MAICWCNRVTKHCIAVTSNAPRRPENLLLMSSSQPDMTAAACTVIDSVRRRNVYCRNPLFQLMTNTSYESDVFISDCSDLSRFRVTAICGSWLSNMAGKQEAAAQHNTTER